jgi:hypothetical protein
MHPKALTVLLIAMNGLARENLMTDFDTPLHFLFSPPFGR